VRSMRACVPPPSPIVICDEEDVRGVPVDCLKGLFVGGEVRGAAVRPTSRSTAGGLAGHPLMLDMRVIFVDISAARLGLSSSEMEARACHSSISV